MARIKEGGEVETVESNATGGSSNEVSTEFQEQDDKQLDDVNETDASATDVDENSAELTDETDNLQTDDSPLEDETPLESGLPEGRPEEQLEQQKVNETKLADLNEDNDFVDEMPLDGDEEQKISDGDGKIVKTENDDALKDTDKNAEQNVDGNDGKEQEQVEKLRCRNEDLEGKTHPETGVPFERKQVAADGKIYEVVVPKFDSQFDARLPEDKFKETDREQFKECNSQLKKAVGEDENLRAKFDEEQLEQIENGDTPDGYTWHHDAEAGKMQLVDTETHQKTGHTGGRSIWGGGTENR